MINLQKVNDLLTKIEKNNETILELEKQKTALFTSLNSMRKTVENNNKHMIGKTAICTNENDLGSYECVCSAVKCLDNFSVKPLFNFKGKKFIVTSYKWKN